MMAAQDTFTDIGFSRKYTTKLTNLSLTWNVDAGQLKKAVKAKTKTISEKTFNRIVKKSVQETRKLIAEHIYERFENKIKGSTPLTKELLEVLMAVCRKIALSQDKHYIKFIQNDDLSMTVEFMMFDLALYGRETRSLRSMYYRRGGRVLKDKNKTSKKKRKLHIQQVYINQTYRQKGGGNKFPGLGWIVEFGRVASGWINPRTFEGDVTAHYTKRIEGQNKDGSAIVNKNRKRRMLLIWDEERKGYVFRAKAKFSQSRGKEAVYKKNKVFDTNIIKYAIKTLKEQLEKNTKAGVWKVS